VLPLLMVRLCLCHDDGPVSNVEQPRAAGKRSSADQARANSFVLSLLLQDLGVLLLLGLVVEAAIMTPITRAPDCPSRCLAPCCQSKALSPSSSSHGR